MQATEPQVLKDGYAFEVLREDWKTCPADDWDTVMVVPSEAATAAHVGARMIDGYTCRVYRTADGRFLAQRPC